MLCTRMWSRGITHSLPKFAASFKASTSYTTHGNASQPDAVSETDKHSGWYSETFYSPIKLHYWMQQRERRTAALLFFGFFLPCQTSVSGSWSHTPSSQTEDCLSGSWWHWCLKERQRQHGRRAKFKVYTLRLPPQLRDKVERSSHRLRRCPRSAGTAAPPPLCPWRLLARQACLSV